MARHWQWGAGMSTGKYCRFLGWSRPWGMAFRQGGTQAGGDWPRAGAVGSWPNTGKMRSRHRLEGSFTGGGGDTPGRRTTSSGGKPHWRRSRGRGGRWGKSPPERCPSCSGGHARPGSPFTAELAPAGVSPNPDMSGLSLLGPTIHCRGRISPCKHVKDRRLHIRTCFFAAPLLH